MTSNLTIFLLVKTVTRHSHYIQKFSCKRCIMTNRKILLRSINRENMWTSVDMEFSLKYSARYFYKLMSAADGCDIEYHVSCTIYHFVNCITAIDLDALPFIHQQERVVWKASDESAAGFRNHFHVQITVILHECSCGFLRAGNPHKTPQCIDKRCFRASQAVKFSLINLTAIRSTLPKHCLAGSKSLIPVAI